MGNHFEFYILFSIPTSISQKIYNFFPSDITCIIDTLTLYFALFTRWLKDLTGLLLESSSLLSCRVFNYLGFFSSAVSNYILVLITVERLIAVTKPHKAQMLCTMKNAGFAVIFIFVFICIVCIPVLSGMEPGYHFIFDKDDLNFVLYGNCYYCCTMNIVPLRLMFFVIGIIIPFLSILIGNITLLVSLANTRKTRHAMTSINKSQTDTQLQSLTTSLLLVSFSYLLLTFPYTVYSLVAPTIHHLYSSYSEYWCSKQLCYSATLSILCINYSVNFILYCIGGKRFRNEFLTMIRCNETVSSKLAVAAARNIEDSTQPGTSQM